MKTVQVQFLLLLYAWSASCLLKDGGSTNDDNVSQIREQLTQLQSQVVTMQQSLMDKDRNIASQNNRILALESRVSSAIGQVNTLQISLTNQNTVAFTVSKLYSGYLANVVIIYDKVITNAGNGYNPKTGKFVCPSAGQYLFTWNVLSGASNEACDVYIFRNGEKLLVTYSHENSGSYYEAASNSIILSLNVGDQVWTQTQYCQYYHGYPNTAFSGMKI